MSRISSAHVVFSRIGLSWLLLPGLLFLPDLLGRPITEADRQHWAFQPLRRAEPPRKMRAKVRNPIDAFILARLETNHLGLASRAGKEQLIRRVSFDLVGLPPSIAEIDSFLQDQSPQAYERVVDRLLASPHYGERWGRHWLDLARFAESDGFEHDAVRPHSWRYRDYVVKSFNEDKPYDRFIREQIAGDELFPDNPDAMIATGFNLLGPDMVDSADQVQRRLNTLNDMTDTAASVFLGQTLGCARCHNHKFEPFSQRDYYQLQAFFAPARFEREWPVPTRAERAAHETEMAKYDAFTQGQRQQIEAIEKPYREQIYAAKLAKLSEEARLAHQTPKEKRTVEMQNLVHETADSLKISDGELLKQMSRDDKSRHRELLDHLKKFARPAPLPLAMALQNGGPPSRTFILARGDYNSPGDEVQPGFPEILGGSDTASSFSNKLSRAALANWIASAENPLTARVMVNRVWQHHFGRGIVPSPSELGTRGEAPSHPELLDWLAQEFMAGGWSVKKLHKLILLSQTYQQSSEPSPAALARDPDNALFSRQSRVRLEGEAIRDSLLAISSQLSDRQGGPSVFPPLPAGLEKGLNNWTVSPEPSERARRSLYIFARRNLRYPFLEVFDAPDNNLTCPQRGRATTAPQALTLLNSEEVMAAAKATAKRLGETKGDPTARAFRFILGRLPTSAERNLVREFMRSSPNATAVESATPRAQFFPLSPRGTSGERAGERGGQVANGQINHEQNGPSPLLPRREEREKTPMTSGSSPQPSRTERALEELCRTLFNLNAFVYVD